MISVLLNLLSFVLWSNYGLSQWMLQMYLKRICSLLSSGECSLNVHQNSWLRALSRFSICLFDVLSTSRIHHCKKDNWRVIYSFFLLVFTSCIFKLLSDTYIFKTACLLGELIIFIIILSLFIPVNIPCSEIYFT